MSSSHLHSPGGELPLRGDAPPSAQSQSSAVIKSEKPQRLQQQQHPPFLGILPPFSVPSPASNSEDASTTVPAAVVEVVTAMNPTATAVSNHPENKLNNSNGGGDMRTGGAPARVFLNEKIVPYLLEGMKAVTKDQPPNPLRVLGEFLIQKSNEIEGEPVATTASNN